MATDTVDLVALVDGLGHGPDAADAAARACSVVLANPDQPVDVLLERAHEALTDTRGVAMTIASITRAGEMRWAGVGNVEAHLIRRAWPRSEAAASAGLYGGVLGLKLPPVRVSHVQLAPGDLVVMATDGVRPDFTSDIPVSERVDRLVTHLLDTYARAHDDAGIVVVRYLDGGT